MGKTDCCFGIRMNEHGTRPDQPMHQHLTTCTAFQETVNINALPELFNDSKQIDHKAHVLNGILNNCDIIDSNDNWSQLCFLEAFYIKKLSPSINNRLKVSKELQSFCYVLDNIFSLAFIVHLMLLIAFNRFHCKYICNTFRF